MIMQVITLMGCAVAGYAFGGVWGAAGLLLLWAGVLLVCDRFGMGSATSVSQPEVAAGKSDSADVEAMVDSLEEVARERKWSLEKRLEIARMACESPSVPIEKVEDLYDRGLRVVPNDTGQEANSDPEDPRRGWKIAP
ncbi:MAG: hypothetical protein AMJ66_00040 [Betaproteobacteria bacterium SG8_40]|jgi:hypothetical protein|nr:MAG: hypothetical protein AMJ66_00040 [Betaproteobacteria bacterium SG8_40]